MAKKKKGAEEESVTPAIDGVKVSGLSVREIELKGTFKIIAFEDNDPSTVPSDTLCESPSGKNREVIARLNEILETPLEHVRKYLDDLIAGQSAEDYWDDLGEIFGGVSVVEKYITYLGKTFHFAKNYLESVHNIPVPSVEFSTWEEKLFASEIDGQKRHASTEENLIYEAMSIIGIIKYVGEFLKASINNSVAPLTLDSSLHLADMIASIELSCALIQKASKKKPPATRITAADRFKKSELLREKEQEIAELREMADEVAIKLKRDGITPKYITVSRICEELLTKSFSSGKPFRSRWASIDGMRTYLKLDHNPKKKPEFRNAKSTRGKFNA